MKVLRVLVADDEADLAQSLAILLEGPGRNVRVATSGQGAIEIAAAFEPHVVILDLRMPGMDGFVTATKLRQQASSAHAIYVAHTAFDEPAMRAKSRQAGFQHYLRKPAEPGDFEGIFALLTA